MATIGFIRVSTLDQDTEKINWTYYSLPILISWVMLSLLKKKYLVLKIIRNASWGNYWKLYPKEV